MMCPTCGGSGYCTRCDGYPVTTGDDGNEFFCTECNGTGWCVTCDGLGNIDDEPLDVDID